MTYFNINKEAFRRETTYLPEKAAYEYRPRGFYEVEYPDIPYPEVVDYTELSSYSHRTVIRPLDGDCFQYVSNQIISLEDEHDIWWHSNRLTKEEWLEIYGGAE